MIIASEGDRVWTIGGSTGGDSDRDTPPLASINRRLEKELDGEIGGLRSSPSSNLRFLDAGGDGGPTAPAPHRGGRGLDDDHAGADACSCFGEERGLWNAFEGIWVEW
jgi:hypothetical protein